MSHFYEPRLQRLVIRIMWMPVVFGVDNWCALRFKELNLYFTALTGWYEAWVIYSFYCYLESYLERGQPPGSLATSERVTSLPPHKHMVPCCCLPAWRMDNGEFVRKNKIGVLQYTVVQTCCTTVTFVTQFVHKFHDGELSADWAYMYVTVAVNVSQLVALYCLVLFYHAMDEDLKPIRPLPKFLCVKLVVFVSFWQEMLIAALVHFHVIHAKDSWTTYTVEDVANGIQAFLMCCEMLLAAIAHGYAFPVADYAPPPGMERPKFGDNVKHMISCGDALDDLGAIVGCSRNPPVLDGDDVEMGTMGTPAAQLSAAKAEAQAEEERAAAEEKARRKEKRRKRKEAEAAAAAAAEAAEAAAVASRATSTAPSAAPSAAPSRASVGVPPSRQATSTAVAPQPAPLELQPPPLLEVWAEAATEKLSSMFGAVGLGQVPQRASTARTSAAGEGGAPGAAAAVAVWPPAPQVVQSPRRVRTSRSAAPSEH